jgi:hypothetical protein
MKNRTSLILFVFCSFSIGTIQAQNFDDYQKQEKAKMQQYSARQKEGISQLKKQYADYVAKRDQEWSDYLKKEWVAYQTFSGVPLPRTPKPKTLPVYEPPREPEKTPIPPPDTKPEKTTAEPNMPLPEVVIPLPVPEPIPAPVEPIRKPAENQRGAMVVSIPFFGRTFPISYDPVLARSVMPAVSQKSISDFWDQASGCNYTPAIEQLLEAKTDLNTNDFGYLSLVQAFSAKLYPTDQNAAQLLTWFILVRSGYAVRIGFLKNEVALLIPSLEQVYQLNFLTMNNTRYYLFPNLQAASFYTYDKDYQSGRMFDFRMDYPVRFAGRKAEKAVAFDFEGKNYQLKIAYDPDLIEFYKTYPSMGFDVYFDAPASVQAKESLAESLKPILDGMDELKAVNLLLHFVQTGFAYQTDPEQFGREKYFFPDEVFHYPYCDCEDRSVLFSYLVKELVGLKVIGLEYPGHMSTAVSFHSEQSGDYLVFENNRYLIADPTFIQAPVGMTMPDYKSVSPTVHRIRCDVAEKLTLDQSWQTLQAAGCYKGSNRNNGAIQPDGDCVLTGYYTNPVQLGSIALPGAVSNHRCFVTKLDESGKALWAKSLVSTGNAVGMSVSVPPDGGILVAGVFTGQMALGDKSIRSAEGQSDLFLARFSRNGTLEWLNRGALETLPQEPVTAFTVLFEANGLKKETKHAGQQMEESQMGLFLLPDGNIQYSGMITHTLAVAEGKKPEAFAAATKLDLIALLKEESAKLISQQTDKDMAGLLAGLKLVKDMGVSLTGAQTQQAIISQNPGFKTKCPNIYKNLGLINFVKNSNGVITIMTNNGKDISFDKVRISNNSTLSVTELPGGNFKLNVLSGIRVGKLVVWYDLNFIKLFSKNGNLIFDYAADHSQASINLKKDILN